MNNPCWKEHFSGHAGDYRAYRPDYLPEIFAFLAQLVRDHNLVCDCVTGNGPVAVWSARYYRIVFATDASPQQIASAVPDHRIEYAVAPAENCPLPDNSVGLVTVAQALLWLDLHGFYLEVRRVTRPGGRLPVETYEMLGVNSAVDTVLDRLRNEFVGPFLPKERALVDAVYRTIPLPFEDEPVPLMQMSAECDLARSMWYLGTWSVTRAFERVRGFYPVTRLAAALASAWGDPTTIRTVTWRFSCRLGRVRNS